MYILLITTDVISAMSDEVRLLLRCCHSDEPDNEELILEILNRLLAQYIDVAHNGVNINQLNEDWLWGELDSLLFGELQRTIIEHQAIKRNSNELLAINVMNVNGDLAIHFKL